MVCKNCLTEKLKEVNILEDDLQAKKYTYILIYAEGKDSKTYRKMAEDAQERFIAEACRIINKNCKFCHQEGCNHVFVFGPNQEKKKKQVTLCAKCGYRPE